MQAPVLPWASPLLNQTNRQGNRCASVRSCLVDVAGVALESWKDTITVQHLFGFPLTASFLTNFVPYGSSLLAGTLSVLVSNNQLFFFSCTHSLSPSHPASCWIFLSLGAVTRLSSGCCHFCHRLGLLPKEGFSLGPIFLRKHSRDSNRTQCNFPSRLCWPLLFRAQHF